MSVVKHKEYKRKTNPYLPLIGLILAVLFGVMAYFIAPMVVDLLAENVDKLGPRLAEPDGERNITIGIGAAIWLVLMTFYFVLVAAAAGGSSYFDDEQKILQPRSDNPKEIKEFYRQREKVLKKKKEVLKQLAAEEKRQQRRR